MYSIELVSYTVLFYRAATVFSSFFLFFFSFPFLAGDMMVVMGWGYLLACSRWGGYM